MTNSAGLSPVTCKLQRKKYITMDNVCRHSSGQLWFVTQHQSFSAQERDSDPEGQKTSKTPLHGTARVKHNVKSLSFPEVFDCSGFLIC